MSVALLRQLSWPELRHHPWRNAAALLAVMLGVALAFSVHLINASALAEFAQRGALGQRRARPRAARPRAAASTRRCTARVATQPRVALASPVRRGRDARASTPTAARVPLRVRRHRCARRRARSRRRCCRVPRRSADRFAVLDPGAVFLNAAARSVGSARRERRCACRPARGWRDAAHRRHASPPAAPPLAVMDIAGAQDVLRPRRPAQPHRRAPARPAPIAQRVARTRCSCRPACAPPSRAKPAQRVANVSRAYRVNLTVLALVALFTGAFLVFSILALSRRAARAAVRAARRARA